MGPKLKFTKNYDLFGYHKFNRTRHKDKNLERSMKEHGFLPSCPLYCVEDNNGKLKILKGHHRFDIAKKLGLGVWYVTWKDIDIFDLESAKEKWSLLDYTNARAQAGDEDCRAILAYMEKYNVPIGTAVSLLGGQSAGSQNKNIQVKNGTFEISGNGYANKVGEIIINCQTLKIPFANAGAFIRAISMVLRVPKFKPEIFIHKLRLNPALMRKRGTALEYLEEIDALYNFGSSKNTLPLEYAARKIAKERQRSFGGRNI